MIRKNIILSTLVKCLHLDIRQFLSSDMAHLPLFGFAEIFGKYLFRVLIFYVSNLL